MFSPLVPASAELQTNRLIFEPWNSHDGDAWSASWTDRNGSANHNVDINGGRGRLRTGNTVGSYGDYAFAARTHYQADVDIYVSMRFVTVTECYPQIYFRDAGSGNRYKLQFFPAGDYVELLRETGYSGTQIDSTIGFTPAANDIYHVRIYAYGSLIKIKWWADGGSEPSTWNLDVTDGTYTGTGLALSIGGGAAAAHSYIEFDNLAIYASESLVSGGITLPWTDDFTGTNGDPPNYDWTLSLGSGCTAEIQGNKLRLAVDATQYNYSYVTTTSDMGSADVDILLSITLDAVSADAITEIAWRKSTDSYVMEIGHYNGNWAVSSSTDHVPFMSGTHGGASGDTLHIRIQSDGNDHRVRTWLNGASEPGTWDDTATDTQHPDDGLIVIGIYSNVGVTGYTDIEFITVTDLNAPTGPVLQIRVGGAWVNATAIKVRSGGAWVEPTAVKVRSGGAWVTV